MAEVKQRVRSELGELRREPFPHQRITVVLDGRSEVLHEGVFPQIAFTLGEGKKELLHALIGQILELVAVELLAALGGVVGGGW